VSVYKRTYVNDLPAALCREEALVLPAGEGGELLELTAGVQRTPCLLYNSQSACH
jgi:hypothetical protein